VDGKESESKKAQKRCFVVMGYGKKTDFATGRTLDLDKSYKYLIKPTAEEKGLYCVRADEIPHSGNIDIAMYRELLTADVVIADLSTSNPNALYELGVRHALRPFCTVVISEDKLPYPFNLNHVRIAKYTHLGDAIDVEEAMSFRKKLGETLDTVLADQQIDSPIYTFLNHLTPPAFERDAAQAVNQVSEALESAGKAMTASMGLDARDESAFGNQTLAVITEQGEQALDNRSYSKAKSLFSLALRLRQPAGVKNGSDTEAPTVEDSYLLQRLVLATYMDQQPDKITALTDAVEILNTRLNLKQSKDPQTIKLAGNIERRLFLATNDVQHLLRAIKHYAGGYYLLNDLRTGIKLAYMLNMRATTTLDDTRQEQIADLVQANRIRREVLELCEQEWKEIKRRDGRLSGQSAPEFHGLQSEQQDKLTEQKFFCLITKAEAHFGLGEFDEYERARAAARELNVAEWKYAKFDRRIATLETVLCSQGHLLDPPWSLGGA